MFNRTVYLALAVLVFTASVDARKSSSGRSRGSSSRGGTSRRTNYNPQPAPTSFSQPAPKQQSSLFGWQTKPKETPIRSSQADLSHQSRASQPSHSYPSSQTGLSGNQQPPSYQQAVQQSHTYPQNSKPQQAHTYPQNNAHPGQNNPSSAHTYPQGNAQPGNAQSHAYPASGGLSGNAGAGGSYPAQSGGYSGASAPAYPGGQAAHPPAYGGYPAGSGSTNYNGYHPPAQGLPPAYPGNNRPSYGGSGYSAPGYSHPGYGNAGYGGGGYGGAGGYGGVGGYHGGGYGGPGGFGGYGNYGGVSRGTSTLAKVGIAGAGVGTLLTGLALWNLARSGSHRNTHIYQDRRGNPIPVPINDTTPVTDPILGELVNCTLTVSGANATEILGIPCAIATSFSPNSDLHKGVDTSGSAEEAKCIITVVTKNGTELSTTIPCSILLNTAKEANVTEPPPLAANGTDVLPGAPTPGGPPVNGPESAIGVPLAPYPGYPVGVPLAAYPGDSGQPAAPSDASQLPLGPARRAPDCKLEPGTTPDPLSPCVPLAGDLSVISLSAANTTSAQAAPAA